LLSAANPHALIIEDDPTSINVLTTLLQQRQVKTSVIRVDFGSAFDLSTLANLDNPDIVFIDLEMPGTNGYAVLQDLRTHLQNIPIVAYSTHTSHLNRAKEAGFHSFLGKPINADDFPTHLRNILNDIPVWEVS
jgi:CheY-like chemotaxis protein